MRKLCLYITVFMLCVSCTKNNGDIGPLFGLWKLDSIVIDDKLDNNYGGNIFFAFQNDVVEIKKVNPSNVYNQVFGRWEHNDQSLLLIFELGRFTPYQEIYLSSGINTCEIITFHSKELVFKRVTDDKTYVYTLKKW